eukprot:6471371-Amphidinium_carterae.1
MLPPGDDEELDGKPDDSSNLGPSASQITPGALQAAIQEKTGSTDLAAKDLVNQSALGSKPPTGGLSKQDLDQLQKERQLDSATRDAAE